MFPFQHDLAYFLTLFLIYYIPDLCVFIVTGPYDYILYFALYGYIITYSVVFALNISTVTGKVLKPIVLAWYIVFALLNLYCIINLHSRLSHDVIQILAATNFYEMAEYIKMYINLKIVAGGCIITAMILAFFLTARKMRFCSRHRTLVSSVLLGILLLSCVIIGNLKPAVKNDLSYGWVFKVDDVVDLRMHPTNPQIEFNRDAALPDVVVILGESFAPSHSSLYGYDKETNPLLQKRVDDNALVLFTSVKSPDVCTAPVFKYILNTRTLENKDDARKWYEYTNLIEVLNAAGYRTWWISSQKEKGMYHNLSSGYSRICDESHFTSTLTDGYKYDGELLDYEISGAPSPSAVFYHLIGQHPSFADRYPATFDHFKAADYSSVHAQIMAEYDNAMLYNDHVVDAIIEKYKDRDVVIIYLSDHGLDVFESDADYAGHAKGTPASQEIGRTIPFMVYMSPSFQKSHPKAAGKIRNTESDKVYCTDKLIYTVMDICGISFEDNNDVYLYSMFSDPEHPQLRRN